MRRAKETMWLPGNRRVLEGALLADDDEAIEGREHLFEHVVVTVPVTEQAKPARGGRKADPKEAG